MGKIKFAVTADNPLSYSSGVTFANSPQSDFPKKMSTDFRLVDVSQFNRAFFDIQRRLTGERLRNADWYRFVARSLDAGAGAWVSETTHLDQHYINSLDRPDLLINSPDDSKQADAAPSNDNISFAKRVFGVSERIQLSPGIIHPNYPNYWKDYLWLEAKITRSLRFEQESFPIETVDNSLIYPQKRNSSIFAIGGPVCHEITQLALQYHLFRSDESGHLLLRIDDPIFHVPFEYAKNNPDPPSSQYTRIINIDGKEYNLQKWSIFDNLKKKYLYPEFYENELLYDYLIITVLPNFLNQAAYENDEKIVLVGGCHIVGTTGINLLLGDLDAKRRLEHKVGNRRFWQALIKVKAEPSSNGGPWRAASGGIGEIQVGSVEFGPHALEQLLHNVTREHQSADGISSSVPASSSYAPLDKDNAQRNFSEEPEVINDVTEYRELRRRSDERNTEVAAGLHQEALPNSDSPNRGVEGMPSDYKKSLRRYADEELVVLEFENREDRNILVEVRRKSGYLKDIPMDWPDRNSMVIPKWAELPHTDLCRDLGINVKTSSLGNFEELSADEIAEMRADRRTKKL